MKNICVFGMGGIGGYAAAHLISARELNPKSGLCITGIARGESLRIMKEKGLKFRKPDGKENVYFFDHLTDNPASLGEQDLIILCVKGYDLAAACAETRPIVRPGTCIMPLLNGIDIFERIRAVISGGIVLPACIFISAVRNEPGCIAQVGGRGNIAAGDDPRHRGHDPAPLVSLMKAADIPFEWQADAFPALWKKYLFIASFALVTGMSGKNFGQILESKELSAAVQSIIKEIYALAAAKGVALEDSVIMATYESAKNFPYETTSSFARDLQVPGKPNEAELFGATILRLGKELGIPVPAAKAAHEAIQAGMIKP